MTRKPKFQIGARIVTFDEGRYPGTIMAIRWHDGNYWYEVRLPGGMAVRYEGDFEAR